MEQRAPSYKERFTQSRPSKTLVFWACVGSMVFTMIVGFTRYSRDRTFAVIGQNRAFLLVMAAGSIVGTFIGGRMLGLVPSFVLLPLLAAVLLLSAVKVWRHPAT